MRKPSLRERQGRPPPLDPDVRTSAARIVDMLQQLVIARPDMIGPLEEIVRGILANLRVQVATQIWQGEEERSRGRTPLPPVPLSELPALQAVLEPPAAERMTKKQAGRSAERPKRR